MRNLIILIAFALSGYFNLNVTSDTPDAVININYSTVAVANTEVLNPLYTLPTKTRFNPNCNIEQGIAILPKTGVCFIEDVVFESYNAPQEDFYKNDVILQMASLQSQYKAGTFIDIDQTTYTPEQLITEITASSTLFIYAEAVQAQIRVLTSLVLI